MAHHPHRPWACSVNRNLHFARINRLIKDSPPTVVLQNGRRVFLFQSGFDRDLFIEEFHRKYGARVYAET